MIKNKTERKKFIFKSYYFESLRVKREQEVKTISVKTSYEINHSDLLTLSKVPFQNSKVQ
jgi:hypothetical protein